MDELKYRKELLDTAIACGAVLTGKPDGSEAITVLFSIEAWRAFDVATRTPTKSAPVGEVDDADV